MSLALDELARIIPDEDKAQVRNQMQDILANAYKGMIAGSTLPPGKYNDAMGHLMGADTDSLAWELGQMGFPDPRDILQIFGVKGAAVLVGKLKPKTYVDNPGGDWLMHKQRRVVEGGREKLKEDYLTDFVGSRPYKSFGTPTAGSHDTFNVPITKLRMLRGRRNEQANIRGDSAEWMKQNMRVEDGKVMLPKYVRTEGEERAALIARKEAGEDVGNPYWKRVPGEFEENAPTVFVDHNGEAWIHEGNHRVMEAIRRGETHLDVNVQWYSGGEDVARKHPQFDWSLEKMLKEYDTEVLPQQSLYMKGRPRQVTDLQGTAEVLRNPSRGDLRQFLKETGQSHGIRDTRKVPWRSVMDDEGNIYYWDAHRSIHGDMERLLRQETGSPFTFTGRRNHSDPDY